MKRITLIIIISMLTHGFVICQSYEEDQYPTFHLEEWKKMNQSKDKTTEWFREAKFGMFIHWGLYSIPGGVWKGKKYMKCDLLM
ncbi:MAG: hypothetical protein HC819_22525 [Cyclobacteriaceae bacterium]|nr:hypothetical protein [Cyclobacteriaceae bacterium]